MTWQPIEKANKKPKKGMMRVYSYMPEFNQRFGEIRQTHNRYNTFEYPFGSRKCDLVMDIPAPPKLT